MPYTPSMSDEAVAKKTSRTWTEWFELLDAWGAAKKPHKEIALHLQVGEGLSGWWAQTVTVEYERSRGLREVGQRASKDYEVTAQRTVTTDLGSLKELWLDGKKRARWVPDDEWRSALSAGMRSRAESQTAMGESVRMRFPVADNGDIHRLELTFVAKDEDRAAVRVQHTGIRTKKERDRLKSRWSHALDAMKAKADQAR